MTNHDHKMEGLTENINVMPTQDATQDDVNKIKMI